MFKATITDDFPMSSNYIRYQQEQSKEDKEDLKYSHNAMKYGDRIFTTIMRLLIPKEIKDKMYEDKADGGYYKHFHFYDRKDRYQLQDLQTVINFYKNNKHE